MILVDSSAWIEYYRPQGNPRVQQAVADAIEADAAAVNGVVQVEILSFVSPGKAFERLVADFGAYHWLELGRAEFDLAAELGSRLRHKGTTVPPTDLIIAASAIAADAQLYHLDAHYDRIARSSALHSVNLTKGKRRAR